MIHEIKKLINDEGMILLYYVPFDTEQGECRFQGVVHMQIEGELIPLEFFFPDEVKTVEEAYAIFKETAQAHVENLKKEAEDSVSRIVTPGDLM